MWMLHRFVNDATPKCEPEPFAKRDTPLSVENNCRSGVSVCRCQLQWHKEAQKMLRVLSFTPPTTVVSCYCCNCLSTGQNQNIEEELAERPDFPPLVLRNIWSQQRWKNIVFFKTYFTNLPAPLLMAANGRRWWTLSSKNTGNHGLSRCIFRSLTLNFQLSEVCL